jgi:hypothetical protein
MNCYHLNNNFNGHGVKKCSRMILYLNIKIGTIFIMILYFYSTVEK